MATAELDDRGVIDACPHCGRRNRVPYDRLDKTARCGQCHQDLRGPSSPIEVANTEAFDRLVAESSVPVVVDYWAPWCGPCRMVAPELQKIAVRRAGELLVAKVNTDVLTDLGERHRIRSIPTLAVFVRGREVARTTGARPAAEIEAFIEQATTNAHS